MKCLAVIPARGGSKRVPGKNIKLFFGKPVISYSIGAAISSGVFDEVMVSTDDGKTAGIARKYAASVPFLRSKKNSSDFAGLADVCAEVIADYSRAGRRFDMVCCILPTAPLLRTGSIKKAVRMLATGRFDCVFPVVKYPYPVQRSIRLRNGFAEMVWPDNYRKRSQDLEKTYHDAGQFYFMKTGALLSEKRIFMKRSGALILNEFEAQDIDNKADWKAMEMKYGMLRFGGRPE